MSERTAYLSKLFGLSLVVVALCWALNAAAVAGALDAAVRDQGLMWCFGVLAVFGGIAIVLGHNVWRGWPAIGVTLLGWLALLKGIVLLAAPGPLMVDLYARFDVAHLAYVWCAAMIVLGGALAAGGFRRTDAS